MVADKDWNGDINGDKVKALFLHNLEFIDELVDNGARHPKLISRAMHCNWKWLLSPERFTNHRKDLAINHYSKFPIPEPELVEPRFTHKKFHFYRSSAALSSGLNKWKQPNISSSPPLVVSP